MSSTSGKEETKKKVASSARVLAVYGRFTAKYPLSVAVLIFSIAMIQAGILAAPLYLSQFFDLLSTSSPSAQSAAALVGVLWLVAAAWVTSWVFRIVQGSMITRLESNLMSELNQFAFSRLIGHSHDFFATNFAGALTHKVGRFARAYEQLADIFIQTLAPTTIFVVSAVCILYSKNHVLGLGLGIWIASLLVVQYFMTKWLRPMREERSRLDSALTGVLSDSIANHSAVQLFSTQEHERARVTHANELLRKMRVRVWTRDELTWRVVGAFMLIAEVGIFYAGIHLWSQGLMTLGDFVLVQAYLFTTFDRVLSINYTMRRINDSFAEAGEMVTIIDQPHGVVDVPGAAALKPGVGEITFTDVGFQFNADRDVLQGLSLHITSGERVALVGPSGAGKSTITKLLLRLYDATSGTIAINGQSIAEVTQESLRRAIAYVPQEPNLFHRTLLENIRYGRLDATDEEVYEAARKAHCHEFISRLSHGYETLVGERGVKLSGGERQRVAIARAILKNAPILVLDEATSSLDSESEALIQDALQELMKNKTVIVIAHRLSTIMSMDRILVLEGGRVVDQGSHGELSQRDGLYKKLWDIQIGGFLGGEEVETTDVSSPLIL